MASATSPRISVVMVSDYGGDGFKDWADELRALEGLGNQDIAEPFVSADVRLRQILASGARPYFQPDAVMVRELGGSGFLVDLRANAGFQAARMRLLRAKPPGPRLYSLASIVFSQMRADLRSAARVGRDFLRPWDWPLYAAMLILVRLLELPGILRGLGGHDRLARTSYR